MPRPATETDMAVAEAKQRAAKAKARNDVSAERGLGKPLGGPVEVTLQGRTYKVAALNMNDLADLEGWIRSRRLQAVIDATRGEADRGALIAKTSAEPVTYLDVLQLRNEPVGCRRIALLCLRHHQPAITEADVAELTPDLEALMAVVDQMSDLFAEEPEEGAGEPDPRPTSESPGTAT